MTGIMAVHQHQVVALLADLSTAGSAHSGRIDGQADVAQHFFRQLTIDLVILDEQDARARRTGPTACGR